MTLSHRNHQTAEDADQEVHAHILRVFLKILTSN